MLWVHIPINNVRLYFVCILLLWYPCYILLSTHLWSDLLLLDFVTKMLHAFFRFSVCYMPHPFHSLWFHHPANIRWSQGSSVSLVPEYRLNDWGLIPGRGKGFFFKPLHPDQFWDPQSLLYHGYWGCCPRGKLQPRSDTDHSTPSGA
jgi:hypothetical protein